MSKINLSTLLAVCVLIVTLAGPAGADTWYVDPNGSANFTTIQDAINAADPNDEIEVAPATYNETIDFLGKAVKLYSREGPDVTTIDGFMAPAPHVVQCINSEGPNTILEGFTITGGYASGFEPNEQCGGGMFSFGSSPTVIDCNFFQNDADADGAGMYNEGGSPTVTNCKFIGNLAGFMSAGNGGGICNAGGSSPTVTNCTFSQNDAMMGNGGGMYNYDSNATLANCILWDDTPDEIVDYGSSSSTATYSDVEGGTGQSWFGTGCIDADPCFVNAASGNLHLLYVSPCIDAGDNNSVPAGVTTDLDGNPRIVDGDRDDTTIVDMGAYESPPPQIHNITQDTWYFTIQAAINDANNVGDEIDVAAGTYNEAIDFNGKAVHLYSSDGPDVTTIDGTGHYHVVQCVSGEDANTILEGFTITGGNANGSDSNSWGGGMFNYDSSPTVTNCTFIGNSANYGGGMLNRYISNPTVTNCTFSGNAATTDGGGMLNEYGSDPTATDCTFSENSAGRHGGGMINGVSSPTITNCTFSGNEAGEYGGGMINSFSSNPTLTDCNFSGNTAYYFGGGMLNYGSSPTVTNCTFTDNSATNGDGGGMYNYDNSSPTVTNCTFSQNDAMMGNGGGMYNSDSNATLANCILWDDTPQEIYNSSSTPIVTYSDVQGGTGQSWFGTGCIDADPCFVDSTNPDPNLWNLRLTPDSPCIDAGDNDSVPAGVTTDLDGNPRIVDGDHNDTTIVDMGAYEFETLGVHNITQDTWYEMIQAAIDDANEGGDQIEVAAGTYNEAIDFNGKAVHLYSSDGPDVTIIDGTGHYHVVQCVSGEDANTILDGFTITSGNANGSDSNSWGGGMYCDNSSTTVTNCTFSGNSAIGAGGGMFNWDNSSPMVTNCTFSGNQTTWDGGGMCNYSGSSPTVTNCTFSNNVANNYGGGMFNHSSSPTVTNCILWSNSPDDIYNYSSSPIVSYSDVQGGYTGTGNINDDPCFVDDDANNFRLVYSSACIDAGDNDSVPEEIETDLDGHPRFVDGDCNDTAVVDMGAFEFNYAYMGDFDYNCTVNLEDFSVFAIAWLTEPPDPMWNRFCDIGIPPDDYIDLYDLDVLAENWLFGAD